MDRGTFGERLKREREMRGVSLEEIATATRISTRFLEALENEQWERLPGGVFNRGFIRAVARFLGLDEENLVAEYAIATDDHPEVAVWVQNPAKPRRGLWGTVVVLLIAALVSAGWLGYHRYLPRVLAWRKSLLAAPLPPPPAAPAPPPLSPGPAGVAEVTPPQNVFEPAVLELKVEAGKPTRVNVVADGKIVFNRRMKAGENQRFEAKERFDVSAADSSAVLLELNGQTVPPLGLPERPGSITLTRKDLKKPQGGQD